MLSVTAPTFRPDLEREIDLYEEVVRLWGMDRIPATLPGGRGRYGTRSQVEHVSDIIHRTMCASGLNETMTYSFAEPGDLDRLRMSHEGLGCPVELINPLNADQSVMRQVDAVARETGATIEITNDEGTLTGADVIYGDIWASMGEEDLIPERARLLTPYRVTEETMRRTGNRNVLYLHCLPSFHDFETKLAKEWHEKGVDIREVTDEVFRGPHSVVFDEAENRMHSIKAVLVATIGC